MIKKIKIFNIFIIISLVFFYSCDKIEPPFVENFNQDDINDTIIRKNLLEYYTGHTCPSCPEAATLAQELQLLYKDNLIIMSVHAGYFAAPCAAPFNNDLRCTVGNELNSFFGVSNVGNPNGMINRDEFNNSKIINPNNWLSAIGIQSQNTEDLIKVCIQNNYNSSTQQLQTNIKTKFLNNTSQKYNLAVYILEDSVISPQKNNNPNIGTTPTIQDYIHRNVLRSDINGTFGDAINDNYVNSGFEVEKVFTKNINPDWNYNQCYVLAYVYNIETHKIVQCELKNIIN